MRRLLCVSVLMLTSCSAITSPGGGGGNPAPTDQLILSRGQTVEWRGIRIGFPRMVEDSRCPLDVTCVWEGNAAAEIFIGPGSDKRGPDQVFVLNTALEPRAGEAWGARVELLEVDPVPLSNWPVPPDSFIVTLRVSQASP